ncbi:hypothetical protein ACO29I_03785 [Eggerthellaceae bacterium DNF00809]
MQSIGRLLRYFVGRSVGIGSVMSDKHDTRYNVYQQDEYRTKQQNAYKTPYQFWHAFYISSRHFSSLLFSFLPQ